MIASSSATSTRLLIRGKGIDSDGRGPSGGGWGPLRARGRGAQGAGAPIDARRRVHSVRRTRPNGLHVPAMCFSARGFLPRHGEFMRENVEQPSRTRRRAMWRRRSRPSPRARDVESRDRNQDREGAMAACRARRVRGCRHTRVLGAAGSWSPSSRRARARCCRTPRQPTCTGSSPMSRRSSTSRFHRAAIPDRGTDVVCTARATSTEKTSRGSADRRDQRSSHTLGSSGRTLSDDRLEQRWMPRSSPDGPHPGGTSLSQSLRTHAPRPALVASPR